MANETTYTTATEVIDSEYINREVQASIREHSIMMPLMKVVDIGPMSTRTVAFPKSNSLTVSTKTNDATALSNVAWNPTDVTTTVAEYGVRAEVTDMAAESAVMDIGATVANEITRAILENFETAATALLAAFSNTVGTSGSNATAANLLEAVKDLRVNAKSASGNAVGVLHPQQIYDIQSEGFVATSNIGTAHAREDVQRVFGSEPGSGMTKAYVGNFGDLPLLSSGLVTTANSAADRAGGVFVYPGAGMNDAALGCALKWMPRIETQRNIVGGLNSTVYLGVMAYSVVEIEDNYGISVITDA